MKKITSFLLAASFCSGLFAQQNHYIYIQTDNRQPFYVKVNNKLYSSASSGYVIIPKLVDGTYNLDLGFPKNEWAEQHFTVKIDKKDEGYMFKNFGDKGWGLFNMQTLNTIMSGAKATVNAAVKTDSDDLFSSTLSNAVNDPNILVKQATVKEEEKAVPVKVEAQPGITKLGSTVKEDGVEVAYLHTANGKTDTVRVLMPRVVQAPVEKQEPAKTQEQPVTEKKAVAVIETPKEVPAAVKPTKPVMVNSDCKNFATQDDFMKLRKKMIGENNDDDMITVARKTFKTRCFTTEQVKNLAVLFLKDDGRYRLFDAAYPFVSDSGNFGSLQSMLTEQYYINRFTAMTTKK